MKNKILKDKVSHIDIKKFNSIEILDQYSKSAFQARNLSKAARLYDKMLSDQNCSIILCLAGSLFSAGLKKVVYDLVENNMVDVIVSTGAIIVDQDFFEGLGFYHYQGSPHADDSLLQKNSIDRIYDTYIDEDQLRICDDTVKKIADSMEPGAYSSREFIEQMGRYLEKSSKKSARESVVYLAYKKGIPVFVPAFSDSSAGFGLIHHQTGKASNPVVTIDSVKDFLELTGIKIASKDTGLLMIGGGVPKNFAQDITVAAEILGKEVPMHKYAIQITVADERDGGLSGSTLREAHSWGKVETGSEQMVYGEATILFPLLASYAYHKGTWQKRKEKKFNSIFNKGN